MIYLYNLFLVPVYFSIINTLSLSQKGKNNLFFIIVFSHAVLFRALADPFNYVDADSYAEGYENISNMTFDEALLSFNQYSTWGIGYVGLNWIVSRFFENTIAIFVVIALINVGGVLFFYKKASYTLFVSIFLYLIYPMLYYMSFGVLRQHISIAVLLFAFYYVGDLKKSLVLAILAIFLHTSSIVFLPYYIYRYFYFRMSFKKLLIVSIISLATIRVFVVVLLSYFPRYLNANEVRASSSNIIPVILIGALCCCFVKSKLYKRANCNSDKELVMLLNYGLLVSLFCVGLTAAGRLSLFFIYIWPVAASLLYKYGGKRKFEYKVCIFSFLFITIAQYIIQYFNGTLNYQYSLLGGA